jgi:hypothetical protein
MKRTTITEVRPTRESDGEFFASCTWIATDSTGRRFGSDSEVAARELADEYNAPRHTSRERGRVSHPDRSRA